MLGPAIPNVEILAVGTELLLGQLVDTNSPYIAAQLAGVGVDVYATHAVGDNRARIAALVNAALQRADGVIASGGLGPTVDDVTREAVCDALNLDPVFDEEAYRQIETIFARSGRAMRENNRKQAFMPRGAVIMRNENGSAPGFIAVRDGGKFVACMPGVPHEMRPMLNESILPWLRERFSLGEAITTRVVHTIAIAESEIDHRIADLFATLENPKIAVLAHDFRCDVKIMAKASSAQAARELIAPVQRDIEQRLRGHVFGTDDDTLAAAIHRCLQNCGQTLAVAESCTGGAICAALTAVSGSSKSFAGGVVAYANEVKTRALGVPRAVLEQQGAVSEDVALKMARGARRTMQTDWGLSTTGIAGPTGGTLEKPVGLVWIAFCAPDGERAQAFRFGNDRGAVQGRATTAALGLLWRALRRE